MASEHQHAAAAAPASGDAPSADPPTFSQQALGGGSTAVSSPALEQAEIVAADSAEGIVLCQRYRLLEQLGAGAMGTVYRALDLKLDRQVAIKLLPERSVADAEAVARFRREARALAKLSHPHIVQAHDADEDSGCHFLVMELVVGQTLAAVLREKGPLSPTRAATYGYQTALGLAHAHERGLVHRDLKPSNLLRTADGQVKILDLGLARFLQDQIGDATLTTEGLGLGTPDYMAPEQFHNARNADPRSDLYSLGCTLYHLIAGRVPFPTSSLAEKFTAHENQPPTPLQELCPDTPAGLAQAISKMLAKRPEDRYQTALAAAEALAPYIAGSSHAFAGIQATASWHGSQLRGAAQAKRKRERALIVGASSGVAALGLLLLLVAWTAGLFGGPAKTQTTTTTPPAPQPPPDPNVITVAQNGSQQCRTLAEALNKVRRPNMTIRILDAGQYVESLQINKPTEQAGLIIESPQRATLTKPLGANSALLIQQVPGVRVTGLHLMVEDQGFGVIVGGMCENVVLDDLDVEGHSDLKTTGLSVERVDLGPQQLPVLVRRCRFTNLMCGVQVLGKDAKTGESLPVSGVCVRECSMSGCGYGFAILGRVNRLLVAGNKIWDYHITGIGIGDFLAGSGQLALFNNSIMGVQHCLWIDDFADDVQDVELVNNLLMATGGPDINLTAAPEKVAVWRKHHNWRELPPKDEPALAADDRIGLADTLLSRVPTHADFLRPKADSPLAKEGAGGDLPTYIGAVPPAGATACDWQKVWAGRQPLTVSQKPEDRGQFRTIGEAVAAVVRPNTTIHVLDSAIYDEEVIIKDRDRLAGLTIESPRGATVTSSRPDWHVIHIEDVPDVTIQGLRLKSAGARQGLVAIFKRAPGLLLDRLQLEGNSPDYDGITFLGVQNRPDDAPAIVQNCIVRRPKLGINLQGPDAKFPFVSPCGRIVLRNNLVQEPARGLSVVGAVHGVQVVGNCVWNATHCGIHIHDSPDTADLLIANNSLLSCLGGVLVSALVPEPQGQRVEIANNLVLLPVQSEVAYFVGNAEGQVLSAGDATALLDRWRWHHNWREIRSIPGPALVEQAGVPPGTSDQRLANIKVLSTSPGHPDFLRPPSGSELAAAGAGGDLPAYVGARPPPGTDEWDWSVVWQKRHGAAGEK